MSYSVSATRATKGEVEITIRDELAKVPETQPVHVADIDKAFEAAKSLLDLMPDNPDRNVYCSVHGSIWKTDAGIQTVSLGVSVSLQDRAVSA